MNFRTAVYFALVLAWLAIPLYGCSDSGGIVDAGDAGDAFDASDGGPDAADEGLIDGDHDDGQDAGDDAAPDGTGPLDGAGGDDNDAGDGGDGDGGGDVGDAGDDDIVVPIVTCADPPPPGAELADPPPTYSEGACPQLVAGRNVLPSGGHDREFLLIVPENLSPDESLPLVFMWHWLAGEAQSFADKGQVQQAVNQMRFLAAIPEARGDLLFVWPVLNPPLNSDERHDEELTFFDDMLACIAEQYNINTECVSSAGVSAGGLWTTHLAQHRSRHLASFQSLSGGVGPVAAGYIPIREWEGMERALPALVMWGGPTDFCIVPFASASLNLEEKLDEGGHYVLECIHNCSHAEPPFEPPAGYSAYAGLWDFALTHPFWLHAGVSPYQATGLPETLPEWCGQGTGSATIRDGECEGGLLGSCQ